MPVFRFPFFYQPNYYRNHFSNSHFRNPKGSPNWQLNSSETTSTDFHTKNSTSSIPEDKKNNSKSHVSDETYFFELFGLKLYFDDILLICLIFFLYQEGVKDDELFLGLVLLLLS